MTLTTTLKLDLAASLTSALDLVTSSAPLSYAKRYTLTTGTGTSQADKIFSDTRTITASSNEDLDLAGVLVDALGATATFVKLKALVIAASSDNTNNVRLIRPASNGVPLFLAASDGIDILPGGMFVWVGPGAGVTVTASTGDLLNVANSSSGTSVTYDVVIIGTSA
jgi:hypothetical protein